MPTDWDSFRPLSKEVYAPDGQVTKLSKAVLAKLRDQALAAPAKKSRILLHGDPENDLHEMVITHTRDTYIRPHINETSAKSFLVVDGKIVVCYFDQRGNVTDRFLLQEVCGGGDFFLRFERPVFHTIVVLSDTVTFIETIRGPHRETKYAPFAPAPEDEKAGDYFATLEQDSRNWLGSQGV